MKITIIPEDRTVVVDGVAREFDFSLSDPNVRVIQWDCDGRRVKGRRELHKGGSDTFRDLSEYQWILDKYQEQERAAIKAVNPKKEKTNER